MHKSIFLAGGIGISFLFGNVGQAVAGTGALSFSPDTAVLAPQETYTYDGKMDTYIGEVTDLKTGRVHEVKKQGMGQPLSRVKHKNEKFWNFQVVRDDPVAIKSDRSEIRVLGSTAYFDNTYYVSFKFMIPADSGKIENDNSANGVKDEWALIWQCQQINHAPGAPLVSPPISLHIENDDLSLTTIQDFQPNRQGLPRYNNETLGKITRNKFHRIILRFQMGEHGSYAAWLDGKRVETLRAYYNPKKIVDTVYQPIGRKYSFASDGSQYCTSRFGIYKKPSLGNYRVLVGEFKFGTDYGSVKP